MADSTPDDLSREIDRLWARVGSWPSEASSVSSVSSSVATSSMMGAEAAWETVAILKRQQRQREDAWQQAVSAKDEALRVLRARLTALESESSALRLRAEGEDERSLAGALDAQAKLESAQKALELRQQRHDEERRVLEEALQSLRERIAAETSRARTAEQRWQAREQQYLLDLKELSGLAERREKEAGTSDAAARAHSAGLAEAKNALEKTLAELLVERRERERAHAEREEALKKVEELNNHVSELSRIWEEERSQWRELWDRERSTWETQRQEMAHWEESLRTEREAWHAELQAKEKAHVELTESLSGKIRETAQTAERMSDLLQTFDEKSVGGPDAPRLTVFAAEEAQRRRRRAANKRRFAAAALVLGLLAAGANPARRWATTWTYEQESMSPAPGSNPTALSLGGGTLWVSDWGGRLASVDPADPRRVLSQTSPEPGGPYRPTALAIGGGVLWTLDAAQARLVRHTLGDPARIVASRPAPGPAPTTLAYDGQTIWSYDAVNRALTRHAGDDSVAQSYAFPNEIVPNALVWVEGLLWVNDPKTRTIFLYKVENGALVLRASQPAPDAAVLGLAVAGSRKDRRVYALLGPSGARSQTSIVRLRLRTRIPFANF